MLLRIFGVTAVASLAVLAAALVLGGPDALAIVAILSVLEISLSFDNAVVNATVLARMSARWQRIFLTVGVVIAVFGMRLVFPLLIVAVTAHIGPISVLQLALDDPDRYAARLTEAHPAIASFGGMFLLLIFLDFLLGERDLKWLPFVERPAEAAGRLPGLPVIAGLALLYVGASVLAGPHYGTVLGAGLLGALTWLIVQSVNSLFSGDGEQDARPVTGRTALALFLYLEVLDASFSFDGVIGAFAISTEIFVIAAGLGIGALVIRSLTVYLVRAGTLQQYAYLEHGAHYAIGALAVMIFLSLRYEVPEVVTGSIGVVFILASLASSVVRNRRVDTGRGAAVAQQPSHPSQ